MTYTTNRRRSISAGILGLGLFACGPSSGDDEGSATTGAESTGGGETDAAPTSTGGDADTTSETSASETSAGETSAGETSAGETSAGETSAGETSAGETTAGDEACSTEAPVCSLEHQACEIANQLGGDVEDCGTVDPWNDGVDAWQAAHDCALKAVSEQRAFLLITKLQGFDSEVSQAYVGQEARSFAVSTVFFDSDPCGGGGCGPVVKVAGCGTLLDALDCEVEPGLVCLVCEGQTESFQVCGPP